MLERISENLSEAMQNKVAFRIPIFGGIPVPVSCVVTWIIMAILVIASILLTRNLKLIPDRKQMMLESFVGFLRDFFREQLGEEFVLTKGLDGCLSIYPNDEWAAFEEKLRALPLTNKNARTFSRFFVAGATSCELDKQGRILVPATLREFAGLEKDVVLTGNINRIEIWSKEKWNENSNYDDMDAIAESMEEMGIVI